MENENKKGILYRFLTYFIVFILFFSLAFFVYTRILSVSFDFSKSQAEFNADIFESVIKTNLEKVDGAAVAVSGSPWAWQLFVNSSSENIANANSVLDRYQKSFGISVIYLLDKNGNTLASSNRNDKDSFVGNNYSFRPYFKGAISGNTSRYIARGITSDKYGYYVATPVVRDGKILGVVAAKQDADNLLTANLQILSRDEVLILDKSGIVISSNNAGHISKSIWPLSLEELSSVNDSNRLGLSYIDTILENKVNNFDLVNLDNNSFYFSRSSISNSEIDVAYLHSAAQFERIKIFGLAFLLIFSFLVFGVLFIFERNFNTKKIIFQKEERFRELAEISKDWIWEMDKNGNYVYTNTGVRDILGYEPREIIGKPYKDFLKNTEDFSSDENQGKERHIHIRKNGTEVIMESYKTAIKNSFGKIIGFRGVDRDITKKEEERVRLESQLSEVQKLNKLLVDREFKMVELKKEAEELKNKLNKYEK